jgi:putative ABC transport system ATP-binding protein
LKINPTNEYLIVAENVHKTYEMGNVLVNALRGVNLKVLKGEMLVIMGPSGCGKTTLLNCMSGLDNVTHGRILINGIQLDTMDDDKKSRFRAENMGFIFQFYNLLPVLTALENVMMSLQIAGVSTNQAREKALHLLALVGLKDWSEHKPPELSGGQQQRVTIARALANDPLIVWADEPTGDLDSDNSEEILDLMCELNKRNQQTFVIATHDPKVTNRATRIIQMKNGIII